MAANFCTVCEAALSALPESVWSSPGGLTGWFVASAMVALLRTELLAAARPCIYDSVDTGRCYAVSAVLATRLVATRMHDS